jgi:hypothetical protein
MKRAGVAIAITVFLTLLAVRASHAQDSSTKPAQTAVESWLALIDANSYGASWDEAAAFFKAAVTQDKWQAAVTGARTPLGALKTRTLKSATATTTLPGAPDGNYVVFQYNTSFDQKQAAVETATVIKESDGTWRVVGYFIR